MCMFLFFSSRRRHTSCAFVTGVQTCALPITELPDDAVALAAPSESEDVLADYQSTHMSLRRHPAALLRPRFDRPRIVPNAALKDLNEGIHVRVAGIVMFRQRPGSAKGTMRSEEHTSELQSLMRISYA